MSSDGKGSFILEALPWLNISAAMETHLPQLDGAFGHAWRDERTMAAAPPIPAATRCCCADAGRPADVHSHTICLLNPTQTLCFIDLGMEVSCAVHIMTCKLPHAQAAQVQAHMRGLSTRGRAKQTTPNVAAAAASAILPCHRRAAWLPGSSHAGQIKRFCTGQQELGRASRWPPPAVHRY
jgi:hypothetical protein